MAQYKPLESGTVLAQCPCGGELLTVHWHSSFTVEPQSFAIHGWMGGGPLQDESVCLRCSRRALLSVTPTSKDLRESCGFRLPVAPLPNRRRRTITPKQRLRIFERDGFCCTYCGARPPDVKLQVDHVVPVAKGGTNEDGNLATACEECNSGKSDRRLRT